MSQRTFTIFVVMALVTTFATTPLTLALFPPWYQKKLAAWKRGEIDWDGNRLAAEDAHGDDGSFNPEKDQGSEIRRLLVCLRLDSLPSLFTFVTLLSGDKSAAAVPKAHPTKHGKATDSERDRAVTTAKRPLEVHGVRMLELTDRLSSVMKEAEADDLAARDPVVNAFHTFGQLNNVAVSGEVQLVPEGAYSDLLNDRATVRRSDMILLPWSETGNFSEALMTNMAGTTANAFGNGTYNHFVSTFLDTASCNAAVFVNNGFGALPREDSRQLSRIPTSSSLRDFAPAIAPLLDQSHHIFFPFIGGDDDRIALRFVLRLAKSANVTATIFHLKTAGEVTEVVGTAVTKGDTTVGTSVRDSFHDQDRNFFASMADSLAGELQSRVFFNSADSTEPVQDALGHARAEVGLSPKNAGDVIIVGRRHGRMLNAPHAPVQEGDIRSSLGVLAETMILGNVKASVLVIQAGKKDI